MNNKQFVTVLKATFREFGKDDVGYMAAALTYYAFFSVFPLLLLATIVMGQFVDYQQAEDFIFHNVSQVAPGSVDLFQNTLVDAIKNRQNAGWLVLVGVIVLLFSASGAFDALDKSINRAWDAPPISNIIIGKLTSFAMMGAIAGLMILSLIVSIALQYIQSVASSVIQVPGSAVVWRLITIGASFAVIFLGFVLMYRFVPRKPVQYKDVWLGAFLAAAIWTIAKELFALYLGSSFVNYSATYGTLGAVIALLTWIYISSLIILTGAEFASETASVRGHLETVHRVEQEEARPGQKRSPWLPS